MKALLIVVGIALGVATCTREDGEPDPPVQVLVPCDRDAGTCPADAGVDAP